MSEADFEKMGVFYLGRHYNQKTRAVETPYCLYDSNEMAAHALCIGNAGSGKSGLCIGLLEEAAIDSIPVIAIDTRGDVGNILLQFPQLSPNDLLPWADADRVRRSGLTPAAYAAQQSQLWRTELTSFEETSARIKRLADAAEFAIYTPGSSAGRSVSLAGALLAPPNTVREDADQLRERIYCCTASLLALIGKFDSTQRGREHVLVSNIIKFAWQNQKDLDLPTLIKLIQEPPLHQIGALDTEVFYPAKDRLELALAFNNLFASLSFEALLKGEALNIDQILHAASGKPRVAVFSVAHLAENERMFFVTQLLSELIPWMRAQSDTNSLRALLYLDEIADYLPATLEAPTKSIMNTLMKYGRLHGLGVLMSTQRPQELDYKSLRQVGTWFLGRIQSEIDRATVLNGLDDAAATHSTIYDRASLDKIISELPPRVFVINNIPEGCPVTFLTRWTLSYMRNPLTPEQIKTLTRNMPTTPMAVSASMDVQVAPQPANTPAAPVAPAAPMAPAAMPQAAVAVAPAAMPAAETTSSPRNRPGAPQGVQEKFLPVRQIAPPGSKLVYQPMVFAVGNIKYIEPAAGLDTTLQYCLLASTLSGSRTIDWERSQPARVWIEDLVPGADPGATFESVDSIYDDPAAYTFWTENFIAWLCNTKAIKLFKCDASNEYSKPRETERNFRVRLSQTSREQRDKAAQELKLKYLPVMSQLNERLLQAKRVFDREITAEDQHKRDAAVNLGTSVLGQYMGRKAATWATDHNLDMSGLAHKTGASRPLNRSARDEREIQSATETIESLTEQIDDLNLEFGVAMKDLETKFDPLQTHLSEITVPVARKNVTVPLIALAWAPVFRTADGAQIAAWIRSAAAT